MKAIIDLYPRVYLTAIGMHDGVKEDAGAPVETDRKPGEPMTFGLRFKRSMKAALTRWRKPDAGAHDIVLPGWLGRTP
jgi:hypothetical protein